jgi:hypothetical protein
MNRKLIGRMLAGTALAAGLVALAAQVTAADHVSGVPAAADAATATDQARDSGDLAVDLNNWQESRLVSGTGSKFKPGGPPFTPPGPPPNKPPVKP